MPKAHKKKMETNACLDVTINVPLPSLRLGSFGDKTCGIFKRKMMHEQF